MLMKLCWRSIALMWTCTTCALAADTGYVIRATDLKAKPYLDANTTIRLPEKTAVEILIRQGPWMQVKTNGKTGYVRMLQVRLNVTDGVQTRTSTAASAPVITAANRPAGSRPTVTTGVRGFDEVGLKNAQPDPAAFARMVGFAATQQQAEQFAQATPLAPRGIPYYSENGKPIKEVK
jgi:hypothetical protein